MEEHISDQVDDFYFSALSWAEEDLFPISDENYADELHIQEALMSDVIASQSHRPIQSAVRRVIVMKERGESSTSAAVAVAVASSSASTFCKICMETAASTEMITISRSCSHSFCRQCLSQHIASKLQESITAVRCPEVGCTGILEPEFCQGVIPPEVFERWQAVLCESSIMSCNKFYCPFKDCSALMIDDEDAGGSVRVTQSECPICRRLFCACCKVGWHSGMSCEEFQSLGKDERRREDLLLMEMAKNKKWMRCPKCKIFVERIQGCPHITCRCGFEFCYCCGSRWSSIHTANCNAS